MEAGYCYFIGVEHNNGATGPVRTYYEAGAQQEARWGSNAGGYSWIVLSNAADTPSTSESVSRSSGFSVVQRVGAVRLDGEHRARLHRAAVHMHRARATLARVAADVGAGHSQPAP